MMGRLLPRRLTTQLVLVAVLSLVIAQALVFPLFFYARLSSVAAAIQESAVSRFSSTAQLLMRTPAELHKTILDSVGAHPVVVRLTASRAELPAQPDLPLSAELSARLMERAGDALRQAEVYATAVPPPNKPVIVIYAELADGRHLWTQLQIPDPTRTWTLIAFLTAAALSLLMTLAMLLILRRLTLPLARLAGAAEALGRGQAVAPLPEEGPQDVVDTVRAFNQMQIRIRDYVDERTRMLASVSHDLRTPLTALRLQMEFVDDQQQRAAMLRTLDQMDAVTQSALAYLTNVRSTEQARSVDLAALLDSVCEELRLIGFDVEFDYTERLPVRCRSSLIKRALSNLIRNAAQYGQRAIVSIAARGTGVEICIDDDGPGIPESEYESVRKPFQRLELSRNRDTGGTGLGLAIADEIISAHGGVLQFSQRPKGGFRQTVRLEAQCLEPIV